MNVSRIPMQKSAYSINLNLQSQWSMLFNGFRTLRTNPEAETRKKNSVQYIEESMVADFGRRLCALKDDTSIVLCGTVARAYFRKAGGPEMGLCVYSREVSHPSAQRMNNTWLADGEWKEKRADLICWIRMRISVATGRQVCTV